VPGRQSDRGGVIRVTESTGSSTRGWERAVTDAVKSSDVASPIGVEVLRLWADWDGRKLSLYRATVKVAYRQQVRAPRGR
jgi:flavin-binding protein dodecin